MRDVASKSTEREGEIMGIRAPEGLRKRDSEERDPQKFRRGWRWLGLTE